MQKLVGLQILRGVAATLVAGFHLFSAISAEGGDPGLFRIFLGGEIGVDIFFVVSGFIIYFATQRRADASPRSFLQARFWRIFPPYWAVLTLYILAGLALALLLGDHSRMPDGAGIVISYLLLPFPGHVIIIAWTLALEIVFYLIFALSYFKFGTRGLLLSLAVWVGVSQLFLHFAVEVPAWLELPFRSVVLEFLFGTLIAILFQRYGGHIVKMRWPVLILGSSGVLVFLLVGKWEIFGFGREISAGVPAALLVLGVLGFNLPSFPRLELWGESSYLLYLLHLLFYMVTVKGCELVFGYNLYHSQIGSLALLLLVVGICCMLTHWIERPYQRWYRRFLS